jgi:septum formation protein
MADSKDNLLSQVDDTTPDPPPAYDASAAPTPRLPRPPPLALPVLNTLRNKRVILASASPRRRQILSLLGLPFEVIPSNAAEDFPKTMEPFEYVLATATKKAQAVYTAEIDNEEKGEPALILAWWIICRDRSSRSRALRRSTSLC